MTLVLGLDGCRGGWIGCLWRGPRSCAEVIFLSSLRLAETTVPSQTAVLAVDVPLGLLDAAERGGRECDRLARRHLGRRGSSVFPPPVQAALTADGYAEANRLNRESSPLQIGVSKQAFAIFPKIREANEAMSTSAWLRGRAIEVHPEVCFLMMSGDELTSRKKTLVGATQRRHWLMQVGFGELSGFEAAAKRLGAKTDDALDACAAAWSAWRRASGSAESLPNGGDSPTWSKRIWY